MNELLSCRRLSCICLVVLDVLPSWYRDWRRGPIMGIVMIILIINAALDYPSASSRKISPELDFAAILILRRIMSLVFRMQWIRILSDVTINSNETDKRRKVSLLSKPVNLWDFVRLIADGGPLGPGCAKLVDVCAGYSVLGIFWSMNILAKSQAPIYFCIVGPFLPNWWLPFCVVLLALFVNLTLSIWSSYSQGKHDGVERMVHETLDRNLSLPEHGLLFGWAFANAVCEEVCSRGFQRWEFSNLAWGGRISAEDSLFAESNLWQALTFGLVHFYGVPSGWPGVLLTFLYGWLMGLVQDTAGGLLYPVICHCIADYWIFSQVSRRTK